MQENTLIPRSATMSTSTPGTGTKSKNCADKWSWFHSLTRHKKSTFSERQVTPTIAELRLPIQHISPNNNNGDEPIADIVQNIDGSSVNLANEYKRKNKFEKNAFQRFKQKMSLQLLSINRRKKRETQSSATADATAEFVTQSPTRDLHSLSSLYLIYKNGNINFLDESDTLPFTMHYRSFVAKKWLQLGAEPNHIMYKASSEMLGQVWYWGEISRRDAQKQLTDKPTGSFLVRDSETSGSQFTLSFRIINATLHYRLEYRDNYWHFEELQYESIVEMIEDILFRCTIDNFVCFVRVPNEMQLPFPVILKYPLSRYLKMPQLQDLCRRVIQRHNTKKEISEMVLPPKLQEYLSEKRELVFS